LGRPRRRWRRARRRRLGKRSARHRCGPNGGRGGGRRGIEADAEEERAHDVDPTTVGEAVSEASAVDPMVAEEWVHGWQGNDSS
jgi:hypothetical protein